MRVLAKAACQFETVEEFLKAMGGNELPAVKLNNEEMQMLKGGGINMGAFKVATSANGIAKVTSFFTKIISSGAGGNIGRTMMRTENAAGHVVYTVINDAVKFGKNTNAGSAYVKAGEMVKLTIGEGISLLQKYNPLG
jgi:hypothetical protein